MSLCLLWVVYFNKTTPYFSILVLVSERNSWLFLSFSISVFKLKIFFYRLRKTNLRRKESISMNKQMLETLSDLMELIKITKGKQLNYNYICTQRHLSVLISFF